MIQLLKIISRPCCEQFHVMSIFFSSRKRVALVDSTENSSYVKLLTTMSVDYLPFPGHDF